MARYEVVKGYFIQDSHDPAELPPVPPRFGLLDESPERWQKLQAEIKTLNNSAEVGTSYKLFFLARHGQGFHNVAEEKYGTKAWGEYWSKLNTDGEIQWGPDPELTELGVSQATDVRDAWKEELAFKMPLPDKLYCSPLTRALRTCQETFNGIIPQEEIAMRKAIIVELCREENGVHTCDKRRSLTYIQSTFPSFTVEDGFAEEDELWSPDVRETPQQVARRAKQVIDTIFDNDRDHTIISITAHGGFIKGFMRSLNQIAGTIPTGGVLPVLVKMSHYLPN
ncbi:hypothetical protein AX17_005221 [Amanita inopinata Kibby_2008]|nr:hypothetical protein AX17_005221 [Amanita inopinata Kibby_2008]